MRAKYVFLLAVISVGVSHQIMAQQIYKVINQDGSVTYTDTPPPDAQPVELGPDNRMVSTPVSPAPVQTQAKKATERAPSVITVIQPDDQATVRNNAGSVQFAARVTNTQKGDVYRLYFNGELVSEQSAPLFTLNDLPRGAHTFYIAHIDNTGKTLASSTPRTFYLHQASRLINNN